MPSGRPTDFTPELAAEICARLIEGKSLRAVCRADDMPPESTVRLWANDDRGGFAAQYARAREIGYATMADELLEIADDSSGDAVIDEDGATRANPEFASRSRLRVDTRKWLLSKALPKVYGDRLDLNAKHDVSDALADLMREIDGRTRGLPKKPDNLE